MIDPDLQLVSSADGDVGLCSCENPVVRPQLQIDETQLVGDMNQGLYPSAFHSPDLAHLSVHPAHCRQWFRSWGAEFSNRKSSVEDVVGDDRLDISTVAANLDELKANSHATYCIPESIQPDLGTDVIAELNHDFTLGSQPYDTSRIESRPRQPRVAGQVSDRRLTPHFSFDLRDV